MAEIRLSLLLFGLGNVNIHPQILALINERPWALAWEKYGNFLSLVMQSLAQRVV